MRMINRYNIDIIGEYDYEPKLIIEKDNIGDWLDREEVLSYLTEIVQDTTLEDPSGYGNHRISDMGVEALRILCRKLS